MKDGDKIDPLEVSCPRCKQRQRNPCVYTRPTVARTPSSEAKYRRIGQPMRTFHGDRYKSATRFAWRRAERAYAEKMLVVPAKTQDAIAAYVAEREHDRRERQQLVRWLARHVDILIERTDDERSKC